MPTSTSSTRSRTPVEIESLWLAMSSGTPTAGTLRAPVAPVRVDNGLIVCTYVGNCVSGERFVRPLAPDRHRLDPRSSARSAD
jgi:hypothetical protein